MCCMQVVKIAGSLVNFICSNNNNRLQGRLNLLKVVETHLTNKTNFYGKKLNSYEQLIKVVGAHAPSAAAYARL